MRSARGTVLGGIYLKLKTVPLFFLLSLLWCFSPAYASVEITIDQDQSAAADPSDIQFDLNVNPSSTQSPYANEKAYLLLTYLFGTATSAGQDQNANFVCSGPYCSSLLPTLMSIFNSGMLIVGGLFLSYMVTIATFVGSSDGDALSQKYASPYIPVRSAAGMTLLLPTSTGYSVLQVLLLKIILLGSNAATILWHYAIDYHQATGMPIGSETLYAPVSQTATGSYKVASDFVTYTAQLGVCTYYNNALGNPPSSTASLSFDDSSGQVFYSTGSCNAVQLTSWTGYESVISTYMQQVDTIIQDFIQEYNEDFTTSLSSSLTSYYQNQLYALIQLMQLDLQLAASTATQQKAQDDLTNTEWLDIPKYFLDLLRSGPAAPTVALSVASTAQTSPPSVSGQPIALGVNEATITDFSSDASSANNVTSLKVVFPSSGGATQEFNSQLQQMFNTATASDDALLALSEFGQYWLKLALDLITTGVTLALLAASVSGVASDFTSMTTYGIGNACMSLLVTFFQTITFLVPIAAMFAISLPMTPLVTFTSAILSWLLQSMVAIVGAPILALGLISPGEWFGKANPAFLLIVNLFLRPSLNVIGLIAGAKLFNLGYLFFTQAFLTSANDTLQLLQVDSSALMSITSIVFLYAYTFLMVALCNRCYGLIYNLPDKVFTWIGAPAIPSSDVQQAIQTTRRSFQQASQSASNTGKDYLAGVAQVFEEESEKAQKKQKEALQAGKDPRSFQEEASQFLKPGVDRAIKALGMESVVEKLSSVKPLATATSFVSKAVSKVKTTTGSQLEQDAVQRSNLAGEATNQRRKDWEMFKQSQGAVQGRAALASFVKSAVKEAYHSNYLGNSAVVRPIKGVGNLVYGLGQTVVGLGALSLGQGSSQLAQAKATFKTAALQLAAPVTTTYQAANWAYTRTYASAALVYNSKLVQRTFYREKGDLTLEERILMADKKAAFKAWNAGIVQMSGDYVKSYKNQSIKETVGVANKAKAVVSNVVGSVLLPAAYLVNKSASSLQWVSAKTDTARWSQPYEAPKHYSAPAKYVIGALVNTGKDVLGLTAGLLAVGAGSAGVLVGGGEAVLTGSSLVKQSTMNLGMRFAGGAKDLGSATAYVLDGGKLHFSQRVVAGASTVKEGLKRWDQGCYSLGSSAYTATKAKAFAATQKGLDWSTRWNEKVISLQSTYPVALSRTNTPLQNLKAVAYLPVKLGVQATVQVAKGMKFVDSVNQSAAAYKAAPAAKYKFLSPVTETVRDLGGITLGVLSVSVGAVGVLAGGGRAVSSGSTLIKTSAMRLGGRFVQPLKPLTPVVVGAKDVVVGSVKATIGLALAPVGGSRMALAGAQQAGKGVAIVSEKFFEGSENVVKIGVLGGYAAAQVAAGTVYGAAQLIDKPGALVQNALKSSLESKNPLVYGLGGVAFATVGVMRVPAVIVQTVAYQSMPDAANFVDRYVGPAVASGVSKFTPQLNQSKASGSRRYYPDWSFKKKEK